MKPPDWLKEFHRQWQAARGRRLSPAVRPFAKPWSKLLADAGVTAALDQETAAREALAMEKEGKLLLRRHRYRQYLIESIVLPSAAEAWLKKLFATAEPLGLRDQAAQAVTGAMLPVHRMYPRLWEDWCQRLLAAFAEGRSLRPLRWTAPETVALMLSAVRRLTEHDWPPGTGIRAASVGIGLDSKGLERRRRTVESALEQLFQRPMTLEALGIVGSHSHVWVSGPLVLEFPDGTHQDHTDRRGRHGLSHEELSQAAAIHTSAHRLLTVENSKETFPVLVGKNQDRNTLIVATSFPTGAVRTLLEKLPRDLPHYHFGDTDPAGWSILLKLRECSPRPVLPFLMRWRPSAAPATLTEYDTMQLKTLLASPLMDDCRREMELIEKHQSRGDFEQETLGTPTLEGWPFFEGWGDGQSP